MSATISLTDNYNNCRELFKMPEPLFKKVWERASHIIKKEFLTTAEAQENTTHIKKAVCFFGEGYKLNFNSTSQKSHAMAQYLLGQHVSFSDVGFNWSDFYSITVQKDLPALQRLRNEFRNALASLPAPNNPQEELHLRAFIAGILTLLPFTYPDVGSEFSIPTKTEDGRWVFANYQITQVLNLTPSLLASPIPAYLLQSQHGPPLLIFIGTTYPAGKGAAATICADFTPGMSVGHVPMLWGLSKIREATKNLGNIHVLGVSHGAACGEQLLRMLTPEERKKYARFDLLRPPGLHAWNWSEEFEEGPEVNIFIHPGDPVSAIGFFPTGKKISLYEVLDHHGGFENGIKSHARLNNGEGLTTYLKLDPKVVNSEAGRIALTILHSLFGPIIYVIASAVSLIAQFFYLLVRFLARLLPV